MSIEYAEDKDLQFMVDGQIKTCAHFEALRDVGIIVLSLMKINIDNEGENKRCKGCPITAKRVGPAERYYIKDHAHFILLMDYTTWNESSDDQRGFWIHHGLKSIKAERTEKAIVIGTNKPEISVYVDTIKLFGAVFDPLLDLREALGPGRKVVTMVDKLQQKVDKEVENESEVPEPEPDLPPPRRIKKVRVTSE